jgi:regulator of sigma E protease
MMTIILFILVLSLLVVVHEFGHFIAARKSDMTVYEFGIGFPPRAFGVYKDPRTGKWVFVSGGRRAKGGRRTSTLSNTAGGDAREQEFPTTLYSFNWLPLGGFVKIKGENGEDAHSPDSFGFQKTWKKITVLIAGVAMNFFLAALLLGIGFMIGLPTDVTQGVPAGARLAQPAAVVVQYVEDGSPAERGGIQFGDKILTIDQTEVAGTQALIEYINQNREGELTLTLERVGEVVTVNATPEPVVDGEQPRLGIVLADAAIVTYPWYAALPRGVAAAGIAAVNITLSFFLLIKGLIFGQGLAFEVAGPVGIASIIGQSAKLGIHYLINVTAMISLSLAVINILPIPALDGGRLLFVIIERLTGKPVPMKYEQLAHTIGFVALLVLIVVVTYRDIVGLL